MLSGTLRQRVLAARPALDLHRHGYKRNSLSIDSGSLQPVRYSIYKNTVTRAVDDYDAVYKKGTIIIFININVNGYIDGCTRNGRCVYMYEDI